MSKPVPASFVVLGTQAGNFLDSMQETLASPDHTWGIIIGAAPGAVCEESRSLKFRAAHQHALIALAFFGNLVDD